MTGVQLGLLTASLAIHREPWVLPTLPEPQAQAQDDCSGENCTVSFSPSPEPSAGNILKLAIVLNLPAVFPGPILDVVAALIHFPHPPGEPSQIGFSAVFVPVIWYRVGRWMDDLASPRMAEKPTQLGLKAVWTILARTAIWILFAMVLLSFLIEYYRESDTTKFVLVVSILWTGAYLAGGFLGDWWRSARRRVPVG